MRLNIVFGLLKNIGLIVWCRFIGFVFVCLVVLVCMFVSCLDRLEVIWCRGCGIVCRVLRLG